MAEGVRNTKNSNRKTGKTGKMDLIIHLFYTYVYSKWQPPGLKSRSNVKNCNCLSGHLRLTCGKKKVNLHELEVKILNFTKFRKGFGDLTAHLLRPQLHGVLYQESPCDCFCYGQPYLAWKSLTCLQILKLTLVFSFKMKDVLYPCNHIKKCNFYSAGKQSPFPVCIALFSSMTAEHSFVASCLQASWHLLCNL